MIGNLLDSDEQYIAHQSNCVSTTGAGLAKDIYKKYPDANIYKNRRVHDTPGHIIVRGKIINMLSQYSVSGPKNGDTATMREKWFIQCLDEIDQIPGITSVAFPYMIGCGLAKGNWVNYERMLKTFAESNPSIDVVVYKLN